MDTGRTGGKAKNEVMGPRSGRGTPASSSRFPESPLASRSARLSKDPSIRVADLDAIISSAEGAYQLPKSPSGRDAGPRSDKDAPTHEDVGRSKFALSPMSPSLRML